MPSNFKATLLALGTAFAVLGAAGCSNNEPQTPPTVVTTTPPPVTTTPPTPVVAAPSPATKVDVNAGPGGSEGADSPVAEAINKAIVTNKEMTGSRIEVVVDAAGVATLTGTTQNQQQKALAARAASNTPGVSSVKNKIEIVATGGAKSPAPPKPTKVIIVHEKVTVPAPATSGAPDQPSNPGSPDAPASGSGDNGGTSATPPANTGGPTDTPVTPPANGSGQ